MPNDRLSSMILPVKDEATGQIAPKTFDLSGGGSSTPASFGQGYATDSRESNLAAVTASLTDYALTVGGIVAVKFAYDVPASATLNIENEGAKPIYYKNAALTAGVISAGDTGTFIYDGTNYHLISIDVEYTEITYAQWNAMSAAQRAEKDYYIPDYPESLTIDYINITYAQWQAMSASERAAHDYYISDYPTQNDTSKIVRGNDDEYDPTKAYAVGDLCIYDNKLKRCITACSAASWDVNQSCFTPDTLTNVTNDISAKTNKIRIPSDMKSFDVGYISSANRHIELAFIDANGTRRLIQFTSTGIRSTVSTDGGTTWTPEWTITA